MLAKLIKGNDTQNPIIDSATNQEITERIWREQKEAIDALNADAKNHIQNKRFEEAKEIWQNIILIKNNKGFASFLARYNLFQLCIMVGMQQNYKVAIDIISQVPEFSAEYEWQGNETDILQIKKYLLSNLLYLQYADFPPYGLKKKESQALFNAINFAFCSLFKNDLLREEFIESFIQQEQEKGNIR